jgi:hypothetical protein
VPYAMISVTHPDAEVKGEDNFNGGNPQLRH